MKVAAIQMNSGDDVSANLQCVLSLTAEAAENNAEIVAFPENMLYIGSDKFFDFEFEGEEITALRNAAKTHNLYLLAGSIPERIENDERHYNTSLLFSPDGNELVRYRKIHLFDADLPDVDHKRLESKRVKAGDKAVTTEIPFGKIGLAICFDLRFPELFRALAFDGAKAIFLPSNFTHYTGKDHWLPLIKARAIENQTYMIAPAQIGEKSQGEVSHGKTVIVDPWGMVMAIADDLDETIIYAELDMDILISLRRRIPVLKSATHWQSFFKA